MSRAIKRPVVGDELDKLVDNFNGDDAHLVKCIKALLALDARGALAPHGIGGHARSLLNAAGARLIARSGAGS